MTRVLIVDDDVVRAGALARIVSSIGFTVVGSMRSVAVDDGASEGVDMVVLGSANGRAADLIQVLGTSLRAKPILALGPWGDADAVVAAFRAGATGYLPVDAHPRHVASALRLVADHREAASRPQASGNGSAAPRPRATPRLTPREVEILDLLAAGTRTRDVAEKLSISRRTVERHLYNACCKLEVSGRHQAIEALARMRTGAGR